ncbi:MAG TPA: hypothetical protein VFM60_07830, partial [Salinimicrobium sp.]|nr:hypothetical protein [Salinimicrobium sp.]
GGDFQVRYNENDEKVIFSDDIRLVLRSTRDSLGRIEIVKTAQGSSYEEAYKRAGKIIYNTSFSNNELVIDQYLTTDPENKYREQEVRVVVYLPKGTILKVSEEIRSIGYYNDILEDGEEGHFLMINENGTECLDCPEENFEDPWEDSDSQWDPQETDSIGKNGAIQPTNDNDTLIQN